MKAIHMILENSDKTAKSDDFQWIRSADDIEQWTIENAAMTARVEAALLKSGTALNEPQIWEALAGAFSPEWLAAKTALSSAEKFLAFLNSPANTSLGLIGDALDSNETNEANDNFIQSLVKFTVINETLRARADLNYLLGILLVQQKTLYASAEAALEAGRATAVLDAVLGESADAKKQAGVKNPSVGLREKFHSYTKNLLKIERKNSRAQNQTSPLHEIHQ